ncbi:MAG: hypothetical protein H6736_22090 [Alphaproteobacteria bacterium]|nr:hypothetical protein [Alphaproteobacteria bacterium]
MEMTLQRYLNNPVTSSAIAVVINGVFLWIAVLGQCWVVGSFILSVGLFALTVLVRTGRMNRWLALAAGAVLIAVNYAALGLAVLAQFWVIGSTLLGTWQMISLVRVCFPREHEDA